MKIISFFLLLFHTNNNKQYAQHRRNAATDPLIELEFEITQTAYNLFMRQTIPQ